MLRQAAADLDFASKPFDAATLLLCLNCIADNELSERGITAGPTQSECTQLLRVHGQNRRRRPFASLALAGWLLAFAKFHWQEQQKWQHDFLPLYHSMWSVFAESVHATTNT